MADKKKKLTIPLEAEKRNFFKHSEEAAFWLHDDTPPLTFPLTFAIITCYE